MERRGKMSLKAIPTYEGEGVTVQFRKIHNIPGFSHIVVINGHKKDYLWDKCPPSTKAALYFVKKHATSGKTDGSKLISNPVDGTITITAQEYHDMQERIAELKDLVMQARETSHARLARIVEMESEWNNKFNKVGTPSF
jgi:hypothetical protein